MSKERKVVCIVDKESKHLDDKFELLGRSFPAKGFVSIIDNVTGEYLITKQPCKFGGTGKDNLIVYNGREIIPQILFDKNRIHNSNKRNLKICWFSLGIGGADSVQVLNPIEPNSTDTQLFSEIALDTTNINYADSGKKKPFDEVSFEQDDENDMRWLIVKVSTLVLFEDANTNDVNEAALWFSNSTDSTANIFELFARVTFSTIRKYDKRELMFLWYLYF